MTAESPAHLAEHTKAICCIDTDCIKKLKCLYKKNNYVLSFGQQGSPKLVAKQMKKKGLAAVGKQVQHSYCDKVLEKSLVG